MIYLILIICLFICLSGSLVGCVYLKMYTLDLIKDNEKLVDENCKLNALNAYNLTGIDDLMKECKCEDKGVNIYE